MASQIASILSGGDPPYTSDGQKSKLMVIRRLLPKFISVAFDDSRFGRRYDSWIVDAKDNFVAQETYSRTGSHSTHIFVSSKLQPKCVSTVTI